MLLHCTHILPDLLRELFLNWLRALAIEAMRSPPPGGPGLGAGLLEGPGDELCLVVNYAYNTHTHIYYHSQTSKEFTVNLWIIATNFLVY